MIDSKVIGLKEQTIQGHNYTVGSFPPLYNYQLFLKVSAILGECLGDVLDGFFNKESEASYKSIGDAINKVLSSLYINDPDGKLVLELMSQTQRDGKLINKDTFNAFYTGNLGEFMEALLFTFKAHFLHIVPERAHSGFQMQEGLATTNSAEN